MDNQQADSPQPLPTPRTLLTSLLTTLFASPPPTPNTNNPSHAFPVNQSYSHSETKNETPTTNPLKSLPANQRALLATLHVLFPPPMLLQALDLLDRGLVTRNLWEGEEVDDDSGGLKEGSTHGDGKAKMETTEKVIMPPQVNIQLLPPGPPSASMSGQVGTTPHASANDLDQPQPQDSSTKHPKPKDTQGRRIAIYQVRSSQHQQHPHHGQKSRFKDYSLDSGGGGGSGMYTVYLEAWNCNCAAFAFSSFPYSGSNSQAPWRNMFADEDEGEGRDENSPRERRESRNEKEEEEEKEREWEFGGLSFNGKGNGNDGGGVGEENVPVCKHIIACLLAERWDVLRGFVGERKVQREEIAGLGAEG